MLEPNFTFIIEYKWPSSGQTTDQRDPGKELWAEQTLWVAQVPGEDVGLQTDSTSRGSTAQAVTLRCLTFGTLITGSPFCILQNTWKWISTSCIWKSNGPICTERLCSAEHRYVVNDLILLPMGAASCSLIGSFFVVAFFLFGLGGCFS